MIYGLYLSATGVMTSSYKEDVIASNLANAETAGFKRSDPQFRQRLTAAQEQRGPGDWSNPILEGLGGGLLAMPTGVDFSQGLLENTGAPLDVAIQGEGFFAVKDGDQTRLTRDGRLSIGRDGFLALQDGKKVLSASGNPIALSPNAATKIHPDGSISQDGQIVGRLALFDVNDRSTLSKVGANMLAVADPAQLRPGQGTIHPEFLEQSNADPTGELAQLMDAQRQLEANANMIRTQDATLAKLVNEVGKIG